MARVSSARPPKIELRRNTVVIERLVITRGDVAAYLAARPKDQRAEAVARALEIGVFCLERVEAAHDVDFVRREIQRLLSDVDARTRKIAPEIQERLAQKLGTGPGQVLAPLATAVGTAQATLKERMDEIKRLLDPSNRRSDLSLVLDKIRRMLDPDHKGSVQETFQHALADLSKQDGELGRFVKQRVIDAIQPLHEKIGKVYERVIGDIAAQEVVAVTTAKGRPYEERVVELLCTAFSVHGVSVEHVGLDNQPGDVVLTFPAEGIARRPIRVVVEARDRSTRYGHKRIADDLEAAMLQRGAHAAVYVAHTCDGLAAEIADWGEGRTQTGPYVATGHESLLIAVRWVVARLRLDGARSELPSIDVPAIEPQLQRIRTALRRLNTINGYVHAGDGALKGVAKEAYALRDDIRDALRQIEDALRTPIHREEVDLGNPAAS